MNYGAIIAAATDYMIAYNDLRRAFPNGVFLYLETPWGSKAAIRYRYYERYDAVLRGICAATGIPMAAAINAVRIENRYYERGGVKCLDMERLLRSLL